MSSYLHGVHLPYYLLQFPTALHCPHCSSLPPLLFTAPTTHYPVLFTTPSTLYPLLFAAPSTHYPLLLTAPTTLYFSHYFSLTLTAPHSSRSPTFLALPSSLSVATLSWTSLEITAPICFSGQKLVPLLYFIRQEGAQTGPIVSGQVWVKYETS